MWHHFLVLESKTQKYNFDVGLFLVLFNAQQKTKDISNTNGSFPNALKLIADHQSLAIAPNVALFLSICEFYF